MRLILIAVLASVALACGVHLGVDLSVGLDGPEPADTETLIAQYRLRLEEYCAAKNLTDEECDRQRAHLDDFLASQSPYAIAALSGHTRTLEHRPARRILSTILRRLRERFR